MVIVMNMAWHQSVKVQQIDLETGDVVAEFDSQLKAAIATGASQSAISKILRGIMYRSSSGGFGWRYAEQNNTESK
jgi:hypothetical protein